MVKSSQYVDLANDLEMSKAIIYLRQKDFNQVIVWGGMTQKLPSKMILLEYTNNFKMNVSRILSFTF